MGFGLFRDFTAHIRLYSAAPTSAESTHDCRNEHAESSICRVAESAPTVAKVPPIRLAKPSGAHCFPRGQPDAPTAPRGPGSAEADGPLAQTQPLQDVGHTVHLDGHHGPLGERVPLPTLAPGVAPGLARRTACWRPTGTSWAQQTLSGVGDGCSGQRSTLTRDLLVPLRTWVLDYRICGG